MGPKRKRQPPVPATRLKAPRVGPALRKVARTSVGGIREEKPRIEEVQDEQILTHLANLEPKPECLEAEDEHDISIVMGETMVEGVPETSSQIQVSQVQDWQDLLQQASKLETQLPRLCAPQVSAIAQHIISAPPVKPLLVYGGTGSGKSSLIAQLSNHYHISVKDITNDLHEVYVDQVVHADFAGHNTAQEQAQCLCDTILQLLLQPMGKKTGVVAIDDTHCLPPAVLQLLIHPKKQVLTWLGRKKCVNHLLLTTAVFYEPPMRRLHPLCQVFKLPDISFHSLCHIMYLINGVCSPCLRRPQVMAHVQDFGHDLRFCLINFLMELKTGSTAVQSFASDAEAKLLQIRQEAPDSGWQALATRYGSEQTVTKTALVPADEQENGVNLSHVRQGSVYIMNTFRAMASCSLIETFLALQRSPLLLDILHVNWPLIFGFEPRVPLCFAALDVLTNFSFSSGRSNAIGVCDQLALWMWAVLVKLPQNRVPGQLSFPSKQMIFQNHRNGRAKNGSERSRIDALVRWGHTDEPFYHTMRYDQARFSSDAKKIAWFDKHVHAALLRHQIHRPWTPIPDNLFTSVDSIKKMKE
jgi:hypothetical protein